MIRIEHLSKVFRTEEVETTALNARVPSRETGRIRGHNGPFRLW